MSRPDWIYGPEGVLAKPERWAVDVRQQQAWPDGVEARYLTVGGATVDITTEDTSDDPAVPYKAEATCTATLCDWRQADYADRHHGNFDRARHLIKQAAQDHASTCRAMAKPGGAA